MGNRFWTEEEDAILLDRYGKGSIESLSTRLNRTHRAIKRRISILEGTSCPFAISGGMSTKDVSEIMGVHPTTIQRMAKARKIPYVKSQYEYLIPEDPFWKWLKSNLDKVNIVNVKDSIEFIVPAWYRSEIKTRKKSFSKLDTGKNKWTKYEEATVWSLFLKGYPNKEIAVKMGRSLESVKQKLYQMKKKKMQKVG